MPKESSKSGGKVKLKFVIKRPKTAHESEQHRIEAKSRPLEPRERTEPPQPPRAAKRGPKEAERDWAQVRPKKDPLVRRLYVHREDGRVVAAATHPWDEAEYLYVEVPPGAETLEDGCRVTRQQRARVNEVISDLMEVEEWEEELRFSRLKQAAPLSVTEVLDSVERGEEGERLGAEERGETLERELEGEEAEGRREEQAEVLRSQNTLPPRLTSGLSSSNGAGAEATPSARDEASLSIKMSHKRALPVFQNTPETDAELRKTKRLPGLHCSVCAIGVECPEYSEGHVCAYEKAFDAFEARDATTVLGLMRFVVNKNKTRLMRAYHYEEAVNGGQLDPNVTRQSDTVMTQLNQLLELERESHRMELNVNEDAPQGGKGPGILSSLLQQMVRGNQAQQPQSLPSPQPSVLDTVGEAIPDTGVRVRDRREGQAEEPVPVVSTEQDPTQPG